MYHSVDLFGFIFLGIFLASWICRFVSFPQFWKFSASSSLNIFSIPFSLFWDSIDANVGLFVIVA